MHTTLDRPRPDSDIALTENPIDVPDANPTWVQIGERVAIRPHKEILNTLNENGECEGLPWMPEMLPLCGQSFRVARWANSVCVMGRSVQFRRLENCVVLDTPRCCGSSHGGCQMGCAFLWNTRWLQPSQTAGESFDQSVQTKDASIQQDNSKEPAESNYHCQATSLVQITTEGGGLRSRIHDEINLNRTPLGSIAADLCSTIGTKLFGRQTGVHGPCVKTPSVDLGLQPGDRVRVRPKAEIIATLNQDGKNRGLWFDPLMLRYCGHSFRVSRRVDQFIDESTGKMVRPSVTSIVLDDLHCDGRGRHYCSRLLQYFWREIWLEKVGQ